MIQVQQLSRHYGDFVAVDSVSFSIKKGEVVGLLGHNGAGKTTIMKMLTGYIEPSAGTIKVNHLEIGKDDQAIQQKIGYLPENCPVWPEMTVLDYLEYQGQLHGLSGEPLKLALQRAIKKTDLKLKALDKIQTLSRGYRQRVGVAQAILHQPDIIILDEPTNGLDPNQIHQMRSLIKELAEDATVIVSTHIMQEVQAVCDRVLIMRAGKLVVDKSVNELQRVEGINLQCDKDPTVALAEPVKALGNNRYFVANDNVAMVAEKLVASNIAIQAISPAQRDLETVFAEVNGNHV